MDCVIVLSRAIQWLVRMEQGCMLIRVGGQLVFTNTIFRGNRSERDGGGFNASANVGASMSFYDCIFEGNIATNTGLYGSGAALVYDTSGLIERCIFRNNIGYNRIIKGVSLIHRNNLYYGNVALYPTWSSTIAGVIFGNRGMDNCTVVNNSCGGLDAVRFTGSQNQATNCIIWGNTPANWSISNANAGTNSIRNLTSTNIALLHPNNIFGDPLFVNANTANYQLQASSPCVDRGTNLTWSLTGVDLLGNARIYPNTNNIVDIGAYESPYYNPFQSITVSTWYFFNPNKLLNNNNAIKTRESVQ